MQDRLKYFDLAVGERAGNGGDIAMLTSDLAVVYGNENQVYLALFGGNVEQTTNEVVPGNGQRFDYWANTLLFANNTKLQYNSLTEKTLNTVPLNSIGRTKIEAAVKNDLKYLVADGATVNVSVRIIDVNKVEITIETIYTRGNNRLTVITFGRQNTMYDFSPLDFDERDWY